MVGYNPESDLQLTKNDYVIAGGVSSAIARAVVQPLDVLKIRFQLQVEPISARSAGSKYHGNIQALSLIYKEEGIKALWKGHIPAQILSVGYGIVQMATFEYFTRCVGQLLPDRYSRELRPLTHVVCGGAAASVATLAIQPLDVLRTRFVAQGEPKMYRSLLHAGSCIMQTEGVRGFYKGLTPAIVGVAPNMGLQFGLYAAFQKIWSSVFSLADGHPSGTMESLVCGSGSGLVAKLIVYPLDMVKKRLQIQGFEEGRKSFGVTRRYTGFINCVATAIKEEGYGGLYKGLTPSLLKAAMVSGTIFCVYERVCFLLSFRLR